MTFTQGQVEQFHPENEEKICGNRHNVKIIYVLKGKKRGGCTSRSKVGHLCDSQSKLSVTALLKN